MNMIHSNTIADIEFKLQWKSDDARHTEKYFSSINFWRDILPEELRHSLIGRFPGDQIGPLNFAPGQCIPRYDEKKMLHLKRGQFNDLEVQPRPGRFYPKGLLKNVPNVFPSNIKPFRCVGLNSDSIFADFNHPLSQYAFQLEASIQDVSSKPYDRGGECTVLMECITEDAGMQIRHQGKPTEFFVADAFSKDDSNADTAFYENPRFVFHTDRRAVEEISGLYGKLLQPGMDVLDLMSSWKSHVPESMKLKSLVGLGLNQEELTKNEQLSDYLVHDVNQDPRLPFKDQRFDAVICTVSVEYMTSPIEIFADASRILRPKGLFILSFSNRWFPPKVIKLWTQLHEFERPGLVLDYFQRSSVYENLETFSARGLPRPMDDKYYPKMRMADPMYAVWGQRI